jgi:hypothetical protein
VNRWVVGLIGFAAALFVAIYFASPLFALNALQSAARAGDQDRLSLLVDFPSVRDNLKSSVSARLLKSVRDDPQTANNPFAALGVLMAPVIVDRVIDAYVTPDGISAMIKTGKAPKLGGDGSAPQASTDAASQLQKSLGYIDLDHFRATLARAGSPGVEWGLVLERRGLFGWKLVRIDLPLGEVEPTPSVESVSAPAPADADSAAASAVPDVSNGVQSGPPIGAQ